MTKQTKLIKTLILNLTDSKSLAVSFRYLVTCDSETNLITIPENVMVAIAISTFHPSNPHRMKRVIDVDIMTKSQAFIIKLVSQIINIFKCIQPSTLDLFSLSFNESITLESLIDPNHINDSYKRLIRLFVNYKLIFHVVKSFTPKL